MQRFLRVGTHPANIRHAIDQLHAGIADAGRSVNDVSVGLIVHTCRSQEPAAIRAISRAMAAGFYEYAPALFEPPGFEWNGPNAHELQTKVYPDFHHHKDLVEAGDIVGFLSDEIADSFSFFGTASDVAAQIQAIMAEAPEIEIVVPHPVPFPSSTEQADYVRWLGDELIPLLS